VTRDPGHIVGGSDPPQPTVFVNGHRAIASGALVDDGGVLAPEDRGVVSGRRATASAEAVGRSHSSDLLRMPRTVD
jgi:hypothetical protein